jgi:5'-nucleotidase (lipoprotein e(P4) family)
MLPIFAQIKNFDMKKIILVSILMMMIAFSCKNEEKKIIIEKNIEIKSTNDHLIMATLYMQQSAEYKALCYQSYNLAEFRLIEQVKAKKSKKPLAIVLDIDETVLNNITFEAKSILENSDYPKFWEEWCNKAEAQPIPGALDFLKASDKNKVAIFYITNRKEKLREVTLKNLVNAGFPQVDSKKLLMKVDEDSKESRRNEVLMNYEIIMYIGDNLNDMAQVFEVSGLENRKAVTDSLAKSFGKKFIVLPNPVYGEWEKGVLNGTYNHSRKERDELLRKGLIAF